MFYLLCLRIILILKLSGYETYGFLFLLDSLTATYFLVCLIFLIFVMSSYLVQLHL